MIRSGTRSAVKQGALSLLLRNPAIRIEYLNVIDRGTFQPVETFAGDFCVVAAVWIGETRLIDNVFIPGN